MIAGRYERAEGIRSGGMGTILRCTDTHLSRDVVVKILQDGVESRRLLDEQKALLKIRSKHVVQLYDVVKFDHNGQEVLGLVLEYIEGVSLEEEEHEFNEEYLKTIWQIACGIADIHACGLIHRDIKPNNMIRDSEGVIKIFDFGLSRPKGASAQTQSIIGTLGFMAPELWSRPPINFNAAVDTYAFAATALSLLQGGLPSELMNQPPIPAAGGIISTMHPAMPGDIALQLERCLLAAPRSRPTMDSVRTMLSKHLLKDKHRALLIAETQTLELNALQRSVTLRFGASIELKVEYNGYDFVISRAQGDIRVNNTVAVLGFVMPSCCVITLTNDSGSRRFATFDVSNPEVMP